MLRSAGALHKTPAGVVNRGTRTVSVQRGDFVKWLHSHLTREVKGECGSPVAREQRWGRNQSEKGEFCPPLRAQLVGNCAQDRLTFQPIRITGLWTCTALGLLPGHKEQEEERMILFPQRGWHQIVYSCLFPCEEFLMLVTQELLKGTK